MRQQPEMPRLAVTAGLRVEGDRAPAAAEAVVARGREVAVVGRLFAREEQSPAVHGRERRRAEPQEALAAVEWVTRGTYAPRRAIEVEL